MAKENTISIKYRGLAFWAIIMSAIFVVCVFPLFMFSFATAAVTEAIAIVCLGISIGLSINARRRMQRVVYELVMTNDGVQNRILDDLIFPYVIVNQRGDVIWGNSAFTELSQGKKRLPDIFEGVESRSVQKAQSKDGFILEIAGRTYRMVSENLKNYGKGSEEIRDFMGSDILYGVTFYDETELIRTKQELMDQKAMVCLLYMDNYEEALEDMEAVRQSIMVALVDRKIKQYFAQFGALVRAIEKDKYLAVIKHKHLETLKETKFDILESVKKVDVVLGKTITVSIGLGLGGGEYTRNYDYARMAIDMALARGGDQAVVKEGDRVQYYGGKVQQIDKNTRVKARMKAHALAEIASNHGSIFIMGHRLGDIDCLGAAVGMYRAMVALGRRPHIVINSVISAVKPYYEYFSNSSEYPEDMFVTGEQAMQMVTDDSMLIVVDTNRRSMLDHKELADAVKTIVVFDHHRQVADYMADAILSYVEPFASSASEMVAEILQYIGDGDVKLKPVEADALYAGIVLDTNNFMNQTGVRTFEAAAYLRKSGADIAKVRKLFRDNLEEFRVKNEAIRGMEVIHDAFAIAVCPPFGESPTVLAAQTANELLNIAEIKASFVLTEYQDTIFISARSINEVNVQVIMERLGGGGHAAVAGAQLKGAEVEEAKELVKATLLSMIEEGEL